MIHELAIEGLGQLTNPVFVDVRSESEFAEASIPGAVNIPIFNDAERAQLGTVYRQVSPEAAKDLGLSLAAPKLPDLVKRCRELARGGPVVVYCWRGGMRSRSVANILDLMGIQVYRLVGGYKAFRKAVAQYWEHPFPFKVMVIRGNTGTGKTGLIAELRLRGRAAVDLEALANNRGSVFGAVGLGASPSQKDFEANLHRELNAFKSAKWIVVECESKRIGRVVLPGSLHRAMTEGQQVLVYDSIENRVDRLVAEYTSFLNPGPELESALNRLVKRLGNDRTNQLRTWLSQKDYRSFTRVLLEEYYDPLYGYPNGPTPEYEFVFSMADPLSAVDKIEALLDSLEETGGEVVS